MKYYFENELIEGIIVKKNSQYTMTVHVFGEDYKCYFPCKEKIGNIRYKNVSCLVSVTKSLSRQTSFTIEAISLDEIEKRNKKWICVNPTVIQKATEYLLKDEYVDEIKIIWNPLYVKYGNHVKTSITTPAISIDYELSQIKEKQTLLKVYGYEIDEMPLTELNDKQKYQLEEYSLNGFTCWMVSLIIEKDGISLKQFKNVPF